MIKIWIDTRLSSKEEREIVEQMVVDGKSIIEIIENKITDVTLLKAFYEDVKDSELDTSFKDYDALQRFTVLGHSPLENAETSLKNSFENIKKLESNRIFKYKDGMKIKKFQKFEIEHRDSMIFLQPQDKKKRMKLPIIY